MRVIDEVDKHRNDIVTDSYTVTWRELIGQYKDGDLIINPDYQRLFRWDIDQQTQYIESIILAIPCPPIFLAKNDDGRSEVIDGLQRVSTLLKFFAADVFSDSTDVVEEDEEIEQNDIKKPTCLVEGRIVRSLEGFTAATLPETLVRNIRYARIHVILIEKESTQRARYEVFKRLNKFGSPLSDQEIRNCTARLLGKDFPDQLRRLSGDVQIGEALELSDEAVRRMGIDEMLLRLLALYYSKDDIKHQIREYLDEFMEYASEGKFTLTDEIEKRINKTFTLINSAIPDGRAFRPKKHGFSTNLFDVVATGIFHNVDTLTIDKLKVRYAELLRSGELKELIGAGSNTRKKLKGRINLGKTWFAI